MTGNRGPGFPVASRIGSSLAILGLILVFLAYPLWAANPREETHVESALRRGSWDLLGPVAPEKRAETEFLLVGGGALPDWRSGPDSTALSKGFVLHSPTLAARAGASWYFRRNLTCPQAMTAYWILETTRPGEGWVNGESVFKVRTTIGGSAALPWYAVKVRLKKGPNQILLRLDRVSGDVRVASWFRPLPDGKAEKAKFIRVLSRFPRLFQDHLARRVLRLMARKRRPLHLLDKYKVAFEPTAFDPIAEAERLMTWIPIAIYDDYQNLLCYRLIDVCRKAGMIRHLARRMKMAARGQVGPLPGQCLMAEPWLVSAPFSASSPPPLAEMMHSDGSPILPGSWRTSSGWKEEGEPKNLTDMIPEPNAGKIVFLSRILDSTGEMEAYWFLGADDTMTAWLNGRQVWDDPVPNALVPRLRVVRITLKKGRNTLFLKVGNEMGGFYFFSEIKPIPFWKTEKARLLAAMREFPEPSDHSEAFHLFRLSSVASISAAGLFSREEAFLRPIADVADEIGRIQGLVRNGETSGKKKDLARYRLVEIIRELGLTAEFEDHCLSRMGVNPLHGGPFPVSQTPWMFCGPLNPDEENGAVKLMNDNGGMDFREPITSANGTQSWKVVPNWRNEREIHDLSEVMEGMEKDFQIALLSRMVYCSGPCEALWYFHADDYLRLWVNGRELIGKWAPGDSRPRGMVARVSFRKGVNHLFMIPRNHQGSFSFYSEIEPIQDGEGNLRSLQRLVRTFPSRLNVGEAGLLLEALSKRDLPQRDLEFYQGFTFREIKSPEDEIRKLHYSLETSSEEEYQPAWRFLLGELYRNLGVADLARDYLEKIVRGEPGDDFERLGTWWTLGPIPASEGAALESMAATPGGPDIGKPFRTSVGELPWVERKTWMNDRAMHLLPEKEPGEATESIALFTRKVRAARELDAFWFYGGDGPLRGWLNGQLVLDPGHRARGLPRWRAVKVVLRKGNNTLLLWMKGSPAERRFYSELEVIAGWREMRSRFEGEMRRFIDAVSLPRALILLRICRFRWIPVNFMNSYYVKYFDKISDPENDLEMVQKDYLTASEPQDVSVSGFRLAALHRELDLEGSLSSLVREKAVSVGMSEEAYYLAGLRSFHQGNLSGAVEAFRHALALRPDYSEARLGLARSLILELGLTELSEYTSEIMEALEQPLSLPHPSPEALKEFGFFRLLEGDTSGAWEHFRRTIQSDPFDLQAGIAGWNVLWTGGQATASRELFRQFRRHDKALVQDLYQRMVDP